MFIHFQFDHRKGQEYGRCSFGGNDWRMLAWFHYWVYPIDSGVVLLRQSKRLQRRSGLARAPVVSRPANFGCFAGQDKRHESRRRRATRTLSQPPASLNDPSWTKYRTHAITQPANGGKENPLRILRGLRATQSPLLTCHKNFGGFQYRTLFVWR